MISELGRPFRGLPHSTTQYVTRMVRAAAGPQPTATH
jgi:hypothetical protein